MVNTYSTMMPLGTQAPNFSLPNTDGTIVSRADFKDSKALLVMFICNHCPFVKHVRSVMAELCAAYQQKGVGVVAIMSNDVETYPADHPDKMAQEAQDGGYSFPYLYDGSQEVAKEYGAACTPDFFLFDKDKKLFYRGQMDSSRPGNNLPVTGDDLRAALEAVLNDQPAPELQKPSMGCNIKWREGNAPHYFNP